MTLITAHKILIAIAMVFSLGFAAWEVAEYSKTGSVGLLLAGVASAVIAVALAVYLRWLSRKGRSVLGM